MIKSSALSSTKERRPTQRTVFFTVLLITGVVFAATATWSLPYHGDAFTNAVTGWYVGNTGSPIADGYAPVATPEQRGNFSWFVPSPRGPVSQYPPGAAFLPAVFYAVTPGDAVPAPMSGNNRPDLAPVEVPLPPLWPATLSSVLATAVSCAVLAVVFRRLGATSRQAVWAGLISAFATTAWSVAANMSWTHGPAMLAIALGLLAASSDRWVLAGLSFGFGVLVRPHIAVIAALVGIWVSLARRDWRPATRVGLGSGAGLLSLLTYNSWLWSRLTVSGGYGDGFADRFVGSSLSWFANNIFGAIFDPLRGLLVWSPFLIVLVWGGLARRKTPPDWVNASAVGGLLYLLIQLRANRFSGGDGHFAYRYPLEMLTAAAPWLFVAYQAWVSERPFAARIFRVLVLAALVGQALGSIIT